MEEFSQEFEQLAKLGEGSFGKVYLCRKVMEEPFKNKENCIRLNDYNENTKQQIKKNSETQTPRLFALKKIKLHSNSSPIESLREVKNLQHFNSDYLMKMHKVIQKDKGYKVSHYIVMDYGFEIMEYFQHKEIKISNAILQQIIRKIVLGVKAIHDSNYIHRDIKPSNIFGFPDGSVRIGDFSVTRPIQGDDLTPNIVTRYYRPPEILYGQKKYSKQLDIWSLGCTLAEIVLHEPIFPGQTEINQLERIFHVLGYPQSVWKQAQQLPYYFQFPEEKVVGLENLLPNIDEGLLDIIKQCLSLNPDLRPKVDKIVEHPYIKDASNDQEQLKKVSRYIYEKGLRKLVPGN